MGLVKKPFEPAPAKPQDAPDEIKSGVMPKSRPFSHGREMSDYDIERDRRIHISGIVQAVASSPAIVPFIMKEEDYSRVVEDQSRKLLAIAQRLVEGK